MQPLADLLRPNTLNDFVGQNHLVGPGGFIRKIIEKKTVPFPSLIFWGPPGCGKTTLARIIANSLGIAFHEFSAVTAKKTELQNIFGTKSKKAQASFFGENPVSSHLVFIDEIHRFSKAQQDVLLAPVESGRIILVAATTENPSFSVISPLLSRCQTLIFNPLNGEETKILVGRGLDKLERKAAPEALEKIIGISNGDARIGLNLIEQISQYLEPRQPITGPTVDRVISSTTLRYDKTGEEHYNTISAFIKSMRGSDPNAAVYYLGRMLEAGEDPLFIARRMVIFASEDIGLADNHALPLAVACFHACQVIGLPECQLNLAHACICLAKAPKSNATTTALGEAKKDVQLFGNLPVPLKLRNPETKLMEDIGYGKGYKYAHNFSKEELVNEVYLPEKIKNRKYYRP